MLPGIAHVAVRPVMIVVMVIVLVWIVLLALQQGTPAAIRSHAVAYGRPSVTAHGRQLLFELREVRGFQDLVFVTLG